VHGCKVAQMRAWRYAIAELSEIIKVNHDNTSRESPRVRFAMCYRPVKKKEGWE